MAKTRWPQCEIAVTQAFGDNTMTAAEMNTLRSHIFDAIQARRQYIMLSTGAAPYQAAVQAAQQLGQQAKIMANVAKRNAYLNAAKRAEWVAWVQQNFGNNYARGVESIIAGIQSAKMGTRVSAMSVQHDLQRRYLTGLSHELETAGVGKLFRTGAMDHETWLALHAIGDANEAAIHASLPPEAVTIAKVVDRWQERARKDANDAGAWIMRAHNFVTNRTHNAERIEKMGLAAYKQLAYDTMDIPRMLAMRGMSDADEMLTRLYENLTSKIHGTRNTDEMLAGVGTHNIARGLSQSRNVYFQSGEKSWRYNREAGGPNRPLGGGGIFGAYLPNNQTLASAVIGQMERMSSATGIMRVLGPNPETTVQGVIADLQQKAKKVNAQGVNDIANLRALEGAEEKIDKFLAAADGRANRIMSYAGARTGQNLRTLAKLSKLGMMLFSQLSDIAIHGAGTRYQGRGFLTGMKDMVSGLGTSLADPDRRRLAAHLGIFVDQFQGEMMRAGSFDLPGHMSQMTQWFMKWNGSQWWNSHGRYAAAAGMSNFMAEESGKAFAQLTPDFQRVLGQYNIKAADWDVIRRAQQEMVDGRGHITAEAIADRTVADKLSLMITDQTDFMQLEPSRKTQSMTLLMSGAPAGTLWGEMIRAMMLFKSFSVAYTERIVGRELFGRGFEHDAGLARDAMGALRNGQGEAFGLVNLILWSTLAGYGSMTLKDIAKGQTPRDITPKTFFAAMVQGGGAGIYGDFLFGSVNRFGGHTLDTLAGPVIGTAAGGIDWWLKVRGELEKGEVKPDVAAGVLKGIVNNTPGTNLFWTKWAVDYLLMYRMQEWLNPGHLQRVERQMREDGRAFLVRPSV